MLREEFIKEALEMLERGEIIEFKEDNMMYVFNSGEIVVYDGEFTGCAEHYNYKEYNNYISNALCIFSEDTKSKILENLLNNGVLEVTKVGEKRYFFRQFNVGDIVKYSENDFYNGEIADEDFRVVDINILSEVPYNIIGVNTGREEWVNHDYIYI